MILRYIFTRTLVTYTGMFLSILPVMASGHGALFGCSRLISLVTLLWLIQLDVSRIVVV